MQQTSASDIMARLMEPLPKEGIQGFTTPDGIKLIGYKPQYYVDRLNELFPFEWDFDIIKDEHGKYMIWEKDGYVGCFCQLTLYYHSETGDKMPMASAKQWGGVICDNGNISWPDAYKGAMSNALGKCCSYFGIGSEAYRGEIDLAIKSPKVTDPLAKIKNDIKFAAAEKGIKAKAFQKIAKIALDKVEHIDVDKLTENELKKILKTIDNNDHQESE